MAAESTATTVWEGGLGDGKGSTEVASGAFGAVEVTWSRRIERGHGGTSPEELLAAAHASCFSMALAHALGEAGNPPQRLQTKATVSFVPGEGVKKSHLEVTGWVAHLGSTGFDICAHKAGEACPISMALKGNVELVIDAHLAS